MTTPNTPANAGKDHVRRLRKHADTLSNLSAALAVALKEPYEAGAAEQLREAADFIVDQQAAIERDRAEREGRIKYLESSKDAMRTQLAEREAELERVDKEADRYIRERDYVVLKFEEALSLMGWTSGFEFEWSSHYNYDDALRDAEDKLAEQSAERLRMLSALACAKEALNLAMEMGPGCSTGFIGSVQAQARDALAQIEALAGGTPLSKGTFSPRGKDGAK